MKTIKMNQKLLLLSLSTVLSHSTLLPASSGRRGFSSCHGAVGFDCNFGRMCTSPERDYPVFGGSRFEAKFVVPPLPAIFDMSMTYYNYFNIYFDHANRPKGAKFNQFVPQLMLGTALANSSGPPDYTPQWLELKSWHFGSQYFMGITEDEANDDDFKAFAAVGELHPVEPGEYLRTSMILSNDALVWTLTMEVIGDRKRKSSVTVKKPFMGLLNTTFSWAEYKATRAGSCWENYNMVNATSFPPYWHEVQTLSSPTSGDWWTKWEATTNSNNSCQLSSSVDVSSFVTDNGVTQRSMWNIWIDDENVISSKQRF